MPGAEGQAGRGGDAGKRDAHFPCGMARERILPPRGGADPCGSGAPATVEAVIPARSSTPVGGSGTGNGGSPGERCYQ